MLTRRYGSNHWSTCPRQFWSTASINFGAGSMSLSSSLSSDKTYYTLPKSVKIQTETKILSYFTIYAQKIISLYVWQNILCATNPLEAFSQSFKDRNGQIAGERKLVKFLN
jgi:hypothetical protein